MLGSGSTFADVITVFIGLVDGLVMLLIGLVVVFLLWRILTAWFFGGNDPKEIERGRQSVFAGLIVLLFVFGLWGIVVIIRATFFS